MKHWKVIRIWYVGGMTKREALKWVQESEGDPDVEFVVEDKPKKSWQILLKQLFG
jgi:hypothetical protein